MSGQAAVDSRGGGFFVTITTPKGGTTTKKIEGDMLTVGRAEDCNLTIQHETLSRRHMSVQLKDGQCWVEDHGSSNGTFINGKRLKPHSPSRVLPEDFVQLGQSGVRLSVSVEPQMWRSVAPPLPGETKEKVDNTIVTSTINERRLQRAASHLPAEPRPAVEAGEQAEKLILEAQKKAAAMIQEAELEAERRVEDIYRRAHETQAKIDEVYQKRLNEAYRSAESVYQKSQSEAEVILDQARAKSAEIRAQAEGFVMDLRKRTEEDCERILDEAQVTARELKESRLAEAEEMISRKEEELVRSTRDAMNTRLARFEEDLLQEAARQREVLEAELNERRLQLEVDNKDQIEALQKLKSEFSHLKEMRDREETKLRENEAAVEKSLNRSKALKDEVEEQKSTIAALKKELTELKAEIDRHSKIKDEAKTVTERLKSAQDDVDGQLLKIRAKFEENKAKLQKEEQRHLEELKLETARKVADLEKQMIEELTTKKDQLAREIGLMFETYIKENPNPTAKGLRTLHDQLTQLMDGQIATLSSDPGAKEKQMTLVNLKKREKWKSVLMGATMGIVAAFGGYKINSIVQNEVSPLQRQVNAAQEARKADLEKRKFNPPQTKEVRQSYTDSVIYTQDFVVKYQGEEFQRKLLAAATPFLLKTWRVDEEKVIQLLAATSALVKTLGERRDAIHPDFIPQGIEKMKDLEAETNTRLRQILGSQVRLDSYKKFERKFFEENAY